MRSANTKESQVAREGAMTAWKLAYHANCWGPLGGDAVGVTSITRLAYRTFGDMAAAARDIAAAGYQGIEFFDGNVVEGEGDDYAEMRRILAETKLVARRGLQRRQFHLPRHPRRGAGARHARRPTPRRRSAPSIWSSAAARGATTARATATTTRWRRRSTRLSPSPRRAGCKAHYHPHLSTIVENPDEVRKIFAQDRRSASAPTPRIWPPPAAMSRRWCASTPSASPTSI